MDNRSSPQTFINVRNSRHSSFSFLFVRVVKNTPSVRPYIGPKLIKYIYILALCCLCKYTELHTLYMSLCCFCLLTASYCPCSLEREREREKIDLSTS